MPVYVWFEYGKSAADCAAAEEKFWKAMGEEGVALSKRTRALIRRMESKTGRARPGLSCFPKTEWACPAFHHQVNNRTLSQQSGISVLYGCLIVDGDCVPSRFLI